MHHHYRAYGGWSFAFKDFYEEEDFKYLDHPNMALMTAINNPLCKYYYQLSAIYCFSTILFFSKL